MGLDTKMPDGQITTRQREHIARVPDGNQSVIPGRATWREPGIHNHDREYGFRACASKSAAADLDNDVAELG
jgi:hypothetical protein